MESYLECGVSVELVIGVEKMFRLFVPWELLARSTLTFQSIFVMTSLSETSQTVSPRAITITFERGGFS